MVHTTKNKLSRFCLILMTTCCSLLIAACAGPGPTQAGAQPCNAGVCKAEVTVQSCEAGKMSVLPDPIPVSEPNNIEWTFSNSTPGYRFPQDGIAINGSGFTLRPGVNGNGSKFTVHDDHTDMRPNIKYTVRVVRDSDGVACAPYDPYINNR